MNHRLKRRHNLNSKGTYNEHINLYQGNIDKKTYWINDKAGKIYRFFGIVNRRGALTNLTVYRGLNLKPKK